MATIAADARTLYSLWEALDVKELQNFKERYRSTKLPTKALVECGPATQTLGALLKNTLRETYMSASELALHANLPVKTVRNHLAILDERGWIRNAGRQATRGGAARRTCTIRITAKTVAAADDYLVLPWWCVCKFANAKPFPWSSRAVLSVITTRMASLRAAALRELPDEDVESVVENFGDSERFNFSLNYIESQTGLTRESIAEAKRHLKSSGVINWYSDGPQGCHLLVPHPDFRIETRRISENENWEYFRIYLHRNWGSETGH